MSLDMGTARTLCPKDAGEIIMLPEVGKLQVSPAIYSLPAIVVRVWHAT